MFRQVVFFRVRLGSVRRLALAGFLGYTEHMIVFFFLIAIPGILWAWYAVEQEKNHKKLVEQKLEEWKTIPVVIVESSEEEDLEPEENLVTQTYRRFVSNATEAQLRVVFHEVDKSESV